MKQFIGFIFILLSIPLLFVVQDAIAVEFKSAGSFNDQMNDVIELSAPKVNVPVTLKDGNGLIFAEEYIEWRDPLPLSSIPLFARLLFLESEDTGFFEHKGYDIAAIVRAFAVNSATDDVRQGASTITQQVVRMRFLSTEKTYERKLTELFYAAELEKQSTKDEILEMYMNDMYFGHQVYGIGAAATYYFSKSVDKLNEAEIAFLAAIPNNPSLYDPLNHFDRTKGRQELLLSVLTKNGFLTTEEADVHKNTAIVLNLKKKVTTFPAYSTYILAELTDLIAQSEGLSEKMTYAKDDAEKIALAAIIKQRTAEVLSKGLIIETALNPGKQRRDEQTISSLLEPTGVQAGAAVIDNETREIISLFAGKNYKKADFHRAFQAVRQPGSALKPLLVYAPLFESGSYTVNTPIYSGAICIGSYCPTNIGGFVYGNVTVKEAFRQSHNTAAVRLLQMIGVEEAFNYIAPFGFKSVTQQDMTYAAALGGFSKGMTPIEMAGAYSSFIDGKYTPAHAIRAVKDRAGTILYEWPDDKEDVWSAATVTKIRGMMSDVVLNGTGRGIPYTTSYTGAKTGTTDHYNDLWVGGLNDNYTTAVWVGYDRPQSIKLLSDQKLHLRIFSTLLQD
ncbi:transglycosylase domain-containing protein [Sporosarcina sp. E16_8]|uniref:transglycosylase domain-containing protein n=1 Tax=Sporosarcina sp. E16_8 TaxID=2789295 RepID=UPI001A92A896|nr:transglycosylase domain-containing protein [Sporosarcina sp. E16_8]MBO0588698.1 penicillin-binding protein [Sporosarcina sp. E16_8]